MSSELALAPFSMAVPLRREIWRDIPARDFWLAYVWAETIVGKGGNPTIGEPTWHVASYAYVDPEGQEHRTLANGDWDIVWVHLQGWAITPTP